MIVSKTNVSSQSPQVAANPTFRGRFATELNKFSRHKQKLLDGLAEGHRRGPKLGAFDKEKAWNDLLQVAQFYFSGEEAAKKEMTARTYFKRLTKFADHMGKAKGLVPNGAYGDVGSYIFWTWSQEARKRGSSPTVAAFDHFFGHLSELERAAREAANMERPKPGRPRGPSILPSSEVLIGLASAYRRCTGSIPGAGHGPFSRFALKYLIALGFTGIKEGSLADAIKGAQHRARIFAHRSSVSSPFD
jgi:hypothetical protein